MGLPVVFFQKAGSVLRSIPFCKLSPERFHCRFRLLVLEQFIDCGQDVRSRRPLFTQANGKSLSYTSIQIGLLLGVHSYSDDWCPRQTCVHYRILPAVDDGDVGQGVDLVGGYESGHQHIRRDSYIQLFDERRYWRDDAIGLSLEPFDDLFDKCRLPRTSHGKVHNGLVVRHRDHFIGNRSVNSGRQRSNIVQGRTDLAEADPLGYVGEKRVVPLNEIDEILELGQPVFGPTML